VDSSPLPFCLMNDVIFIPNSGLNLIVRLRPPHAASECLRLHVLFTSQPRAIKHHDQRTPQFINQRPLDSPPLRIPIQSGHDVKHTSRASSSPSCSTLLTLRHQHPAARPANQSSHIVIIRPDTCHGVQNLQILAISSDH
jgi:hypothetical protein